MTGKKLTDDSNWRAPREEETLEDKRIDQGSMTTYKEAPSHYKIHSTGEVTKMAGNMIDPSEWGLGDIPEPEVLEDGMEVKVSIISVVEAETKQGSVPYWRITLEVPDKPLVKDFAYNLYKPSEMNTEKQNFNAKFRIQEFMRAFSLNMSRPFDPESDWLGETAWCIVSMREDKEYGKQNQVRKWILPR